MAFLLARVTHVAPLCETHFVAEIKRQNASPPASFSRFPSRVKSFRVTPPTHAPSLPHTHHAYRLDLRCSTFLPSLDGVRTHLVAHPLPPTPLPNRQPRRPLRVHSSSRPTFRRDLHRIYQSHPPPSPCPPREIPTRTTSPTCTRPSGSRPLRRARK